MGSFRKTPTGNWELSVRNKKLLGDGVRLFFTFDTEADAAEQNRLIEDAFAVGKIPRLIQAKMQALASGISRQAPKTRGDDNLCVVIRAWISNGHIAPTDEPVLELLRGEVGDVQFSDLTYAWSEQWVEQMKLGANYAPGTIRKRIASLSRCIDWWLRKHPEIKQGNPLKLLPRGIAGYTAKDAKTVVDRGGKVRRDVSRDRRLKPGELESIAKALSGERRPDRERPLSSKDGLSFPVLFWVILYTGMRLREAYLLRRENVDTQRAVIRLKCSKQWYGREKWRDVPIRPELMPHLKSYLGTIPSEPGLLFPFADDLTDNGLNRTTNRLSRRFESLYDYAGCKDITEHDLRHEATCQWYELRDASGNWMYRDAELEKIMGWEPGSKMPSRYASFRAEDLAHRLYSVMAQ